MKILKKIVNKAKRIKHRHSLSKRDVVLASYPKCGNTFCRFVISNIISQKYDLEDAVSFQSLEYLSPAFGNSYFDKPWRYRGFPRVITTHDTYWRAFNRAGKRIYVMRDPRDMIISYYHWMKAHKSVKYMGSLSDFVWHDKFGISKYVNHIRSWDGRWDYLFRYEDLMSYGHELFSRFVREWHGLELTNSEIITAVEASLPQNARRVEERYGNEMRDKMLDKSFRHVRSGAVGQWKEEMSQDTLSEIGEEYGDFFKKYKYHL